jgi:hypothetical protein
MISVIIKFMLSCVIKGVKWSEGPWRAGVRYHEL